MFPRTIKQHVFPPLSRNITFHTKRSSKDSSARKNLFSYTSGRFPFNEKIRLRERYVEFDATGLLQEAEKILGSSLGRATSIVKFAEGGFNRLFLLTMDGGFEAVVKMPYRIAGPKHFAAASEAATLQYLHAKGIPVPKVYGYSCTETNPAGVEYLIMEKAQGVGLRTRWGSMSKREIHKLGTSFVEIEKNIFDLPFGSIGSIYFKKNIPAELQGTLCKDKNENMQDSEIFCFGPTADYMSWHGKRAGLNLYRGPWNTPNDYLQSIAQKEIEWTRRYGMPIELDFPHNGLFPGEQHPDDYIQLLNKYSPLNRPTLRHPDLNPKNIFICPYSEPPNLKEPSFPANYETLSGEAKMEADELHQKHLLFHYYRVFNGGLNKAHLSALRDTLLYPPQHLVDKAGRQWSGNLMTLKGALIRMTEYWPQLPDTKGVACPVQFTNAELEELFEKEEQLFQLNAVVNLWREQIGGASEDGWISNERYESARQKVVELKESLIAIAEEDQEDIALLEKGWPFRDHEEDN
ncbi:kinase-like domain-containing protein [Aspergillus sergii]|uniref:Kinase-like domain-containing protein n=1 Tax=Aspergillus sergii TaxID=1034303 RepID=A0A5N6XKQ9_9EURO|nr:kinase-like domain-containing protein [Aspergillus sergii]